MKDTAEQLKGALLIALNVLTVASFISLGIIELVSCIQDGKCSKKKVWTDRKSESTVTVVLFHSLYGSAIARITEVNHSTKDRRHMGGGSEDSYIK